MKNLLLTTSVFLMCIFRPAFAQNHHSVGIVSGVAIANQNHQITDWDYTIETNAVIGNKTALLYSIRKQDDLYFVSSLGYIRKGSKTNFESMTIDHLQNNKRVIQNGSEKTSIFDYLSLDFGVQYALFDIQPKIFVSGVFRIDYLLNYSTESDYEVEIDSKVLAGVDPAIGISYTLGKLEVFTEYRYLFDANHIMDSKGITLKNRASQITLGCLFSMTK